MLLTKALNHEGGEVIAKTAKDVPGSTFCIFPHSSHTSRAFAHFVVFLCVVRGVLRVLRGRSSRLQAFCPTQIIATTPNRKTTFND
ncbi:MAG: hypothetical protein DMG81_16665 [Acidobacteria bacterium]|nr:MAG: hypothetical protein DMG81_16665 [Acidobacteriota bacterium]